MSDSSKASWPLLMTLVSLCVKRKKAKGCVFRKHAEFQNRGACIVWKLYISTDTHTPQFETTPKMVLLWIISYPPPTHHLHAHALNENQGARLAILNPGGISEWTRELLKITQAWEPQIKLACLWGCESLEQTILLLQLGPMDQQYQHHLGTC